MVTKDVPGSVTAVGVPAKVVMPRDKEKAREFQAYATTEDGCPDPILQTIEHFRRQIVRLSARVEELEGQRMDSEAKVSEEKKSDVA